MVGVPLGGATVRVSEETVVGAYTIRGSHVVDSKMAAYVLQRGRGGVRDMPPETRRGWQTPTYEEILDKKRQEERQYR